MVLSSCSNNQGELEGKWEVISAHLSDPEFEALWVEVATKMDEYDYSYTNPDYLMYKGIQDSLIAIQKEEEDVYKKSKYEFKGDGTIFIDRPEKDLNGTWKMEEGSDKIYVEIKENGKLVERWQLWNETFEIYLYQEKREIDIDLNHGGSFDPNSFQVKLALKKIE